MVVAVAVGSDGRVRLRRAWTGIYAGAATYKSAQIEVYSSENDSPFPGAAVAVAVADAVARQGGTPELIVEEI